MTNNIPEDCRAIVPLSCGRPRDDNPPQPADNAEICVDYEVDPNTGEVFTITKRAQPADVAGVPERIWIDPNDDEPRYYDSGGGCEIEYVRATQPATTPSNDDENHKCPFCDEQGFDLIGLKSHLQNGDCEKLENLERLQRL